jgi:uncharacterized protein
VALGLRQLPRPPKGGEGWGQGGTLAAALAFLCLAVLSLVGIAAADPPIPPLSARVMDLAHVLDNETAARIEAELAHFEQQKQIQLVVVTLPDLAGYTIEDWGLALGRGWGIGQKGKNNGLLLLVAPKDRQLRIEVGYGLEGDLPDATANAIIQDDILPRFRAGDMAAGIEAGAQAIIKTLGGTIQATEVAPLPETATGAIGGIPFILIMFFFFVFIAIINALRGQRRGMGYYPYGGFGSGGFSGRGSSGGGFSGGGFSGGGGSFGGGGASGRW